MRPIFILCLTLLLLASCKETEEENKMYVSGTVEGLKKGTLYLQKVEDTLLVTVDSLKIDGESNFEFSTTLESPEIFYLYLDKDDGNKNNDRILFFGEQGRITITTTRDFFEPEAKISGSVSHDKLEEFQKTMNRFNNLNLDLIEARFKAQKDNDSTTADSIQQRYESNRKRRYLYALNFALNNTDSHVSPYIALSETPDARLKYLDSIYNSLSPEVAGSKYGKALEVFLERIREEEEKEKN